MGCGPTMIKNAQLPKPYKNRHTIIVFLANPGGDVRGSSLAPIFSAPTRTIRKFPNFQSQTCLGSTKCARAEISTSNIAKSSRFGSTLGVLHNNKGVPRGILGILIKESVMWLMSYDLNLWSLSNSIYSLSYVVNNDFLVCKLKNWVLRKLIGVAIA